MLNIEAAWSAPVILLNGANDGLVYTVDDDCMIPEVPGAYVFIRMHGGKVSPLYIGETVNIRTRFWQHLNNSELMEKIRDSKTGQRGFMFCEVSLKRGQNRQRVQDVLESALIEHALSEGHSLINIQQTRTPLHTIAFTGNRYSEQIAPRFMYVRD